MNMSSAGPRVPTEKTSHRVQLSDGREVRIELGPDRDYAGQLAIIDDDRRWKYGVQRDGTVQLLDALRDGRAMDTPEDPEFLEEVLLDVGLEGGGS